MWHPCSISFKNLFSHEDTVYYFTVGQMNLFIGPNGIGKSTIIEAITLAITGDVYRDVDKSDFIRDGEEETVVDFVLKNSFTKEVFRIVRQISLDKGSKIKLFENNKLVKNLQDGRNNDANKYIYDKIGITKEDFLNFFVIGQGNHNAFFSAGDAKQKEIINRFTNCAMVDKIIANVALQIKQLDQQLQQVESYISSKKELIVYIETEIKALKTDGLQEYKQQKQELKEDIEAVQEFIKNIEQKITNFNALLVNLTQNDKPKLPVGKNLQHIEKQISAKENNLEQEQATRTQLKKVMAELEVRSGRLMKCPNCSFEFIPDDSITKKQLQTYLLESNDMLKQVDDSITAIKKQLQVLNNQKQNIEQNLSVVKKTRQQINELQSTIAVNKERLQLQQEKLLQKQTELKKLQQPNHAKQIQAKQQQLTELAAELLKLEQQYNDLLNQKEQLLFHEFHFGRKGFKTYLANKSIKNLQDITNYYLQKFETDLQVLINGFKVLKNGDVRDKIEINIIKSGRRKGRFQKFSGGEKSRVELCGALAVHRLINNSCTTGKGFNIFAVDESVQYLDEKGQQEIVDILEKASVTSILVMHGSQNLVCKNKIQFEKVGGISRIKNSPYDKVKKTKTLDLQVA